MVYNEGSYYFYEKFNVDHFETLASSDYSLTNIFYSKRVIFRYSTTCNRLRRLVNTTNSSLIGSMEGYYDQVL